MHIAVIGSGKIGATAARLFYPERDGHYREQIGFGPLDTGSLPERGRRQQPGSAR